MIRNYFKIGFRSLVKQRIYSLINVLGLSVGLASVIMILLYVEDEKSYDTFHKNGDQIYKVFLERSYPDHTTLYAIIPHSFAEQIKIDFPEVDNYVRMFANNAEVVVSYTNENNEITSFEEENFYLADSTFFDVFDIKLLKGDPGTVLSNPQDLVITEETATKYFGDEDPIDKVLQSDFGAFTIRGVCENIPDNSHFDFEFLGALESFPFFQTVNFTGFSAHTYLLVKEGASIPDLEAKFPQMVENYAGPQIEQNLNTSYREYVDAGNGYNYSLVNIQDIHLNPTKYESQMKVGGSSTYVFIFITIAALILVIAGINFMNLATSRSTERAKEVGIRKTLGSYKQQLVFQFLIESIIVSSVSLVVGLVIINLTLPYFNNMAGKELSMSFNSFVIPGMFAFAIGVGILAGSYPAFVLSRFNPAEVLKGNYGSGRSSDLLRNGLVVFQFLISILLIIGTMVVQRQMKFMNDIDLGYNKENVIVIERAGVLGNSLQTFIEESKKISSVLGAAGSSSVPGGFYLGMFLTTDANSEVYTVNQMNIDDEYAENIGFEILEGRSFSKDFNDSTSIIINESAKRMLGGGEDVIGMTLINNAGNPPVELRYEVIGVVKDFNYMSLRDEISPFVLLNTESGRGGANFISVRVDGNYQEVVSSLESIWKELAPDQPLKYSFMDENLAAEYEAESRSASLLQMFAILAIVIACVGLFGLAAYTSGLRTKEIGVRKVMGASVFSIVKMLSKDFTILILIAFVIAAPIAWVVMHKWLEMFAYQTPVGIDIFMIAGFSALLIAWTTVSYQSIKAAIVNPIKSLRSE